MSEYLRLFHFMESFLVFISSCRTVVWRVNSLLYYMQHFRAFIMVGGCGNAVEKTEKVRKDSDRQLIVCTCMFFMNLTWTSGVSAKEIVNSPAVYRKCMNHLACNKKKKKSNCELCLSPIYLLSSLWPPQLITLTAPRASQGS